MSPWDNGGAVTELAPTERIVRDTNLDLDYAHHITEGAHAA